MYKFIYMVGLCIWICENLASFVSHMFISAMSFDMGYIYVNMYIYIYIYIYIYVYIYMYKYMYM